MDTCSSSFALFLLKKTSFKINVQNLNFFSSGSTCRLADRNENNLHKTASESDNLKFFSPFLGRNMDFSCKDILHELYSAPLETELHNAQLAMHYIH